MYVLFVVYLIVNNEPIVKTVKSSMMMAEVKFKEYILYFHISKSS